MKYFLNYLLPAVITLAASPVYGQDEINHLQWTLDDLICKEKARAEMHLDPSGHRTFFADLTDVYYQSMHWEIDPAQYYIKGEITYHFKSNVADLEELHLDLSSDLQVNSVTRNSVPLIYTHGDDQLLTIELGKTLAPGELDSLTVRYEGTPPSNGFGSFEQADHDGHPMIWTLSEPYGVRDWWPGKQDLIDKIDSVDIYITTPQGQLAASNGKLMSITASGDQLIHHWRHRHPITSYLIALAVTNYSAYSHFLPLDNGDTLEILNYVFPESLNQAQQSTTATLDIMSLYNELFGTYPFADEKYGHAQFKWGGGMEHQTMSFMGNFGYELQAHELAHQWFGNKVTCGSWSEIWLNEGFATYLTALSYERFSQDQYWPLWKSSVSNFVTSQPGGSVFVDDTTSVNRIFSSRLTYNKGAYLLHMLRWIVGDDAFFEACRDYLNSPGTAYDFGLTEELQAHLENQSGKDLDEFFQDWLYGQGYPSYDLQWSHQADSVVFLLRQRQSHPAVSFFEMPVPVRLTLDDNPAEFVLPHTEQEQRFAFYIGDALPDSVVIDPDMWILSRDNTVVQTTTSTYDPVAQDTYRMYPTPAKDFVDISPSDDITAVDIVDISGIITRQPFVSGGIDLTSFASGYYTIIIKNAEGAVLSVQPLVILK